MSSRLPPPPAGLKTGGEYTPIAPICNGKGPAPRPTLISVSGDPIQSGKGPAPRPTLISTAGLDIPRGKSGELNPADISQRS